MRAQAEIMDVIEVLAGRHVLRFPVDVACLWPDDPDTVRSGHGDPSFTVRQPSSGRRLLRSGDQREIISCQLSAKGFNFRQLGEERPGM
ncbi:hypothetical protein GXW82_32095 [Streptacidiphilus sp. 4-A2]|nr:hypothetical protein [Streptacidiphilus sp. 4-A2]